MAKRAISLNITIDASDAEMQDEARLRKICMDKMRDILDAVLHIKAWEESVTIEKFDDFDEEDERNYAEFIRRGERAEFSVSQDKCPHCKSVDIQNHDGENDFGQLEVTCDGCGLQWVEPTE